MKLASEFSVPLRFLCAFLFLTRVGETWYAARGADVSGAFELLRQIGYRWVIGWWLVDDGKKRGIRWIHDLGMFLAAAWMIIIPYYVFKTRGKKGFITILIFIGIFAGTYLISLAVYFALVFS